MIHINTLPQTPRLVAKDLEQATRIGLQGRTRHRVVTRGRQSLTYNARDDEKIG